MRLSNLLIAALATFCAGCADDSATSSASGSTTTASHVSPTTTTQLISPVRADRESPLFGSMRGEDAAQALESVTAALGPPTSDSGWIVGCEDVRPGIPDERTVTWGHLQVHLVRATAADAGLFKGYAVRIPAGQALDHDDPATRIILPTGIVLGQPISSAAAALGRPVRRDRILRQMYVSAEGFVVVAGGGDTESAPITSVDVPIPVSCLSIN